MAAMIAMKCTKASDSNTHTHMYHGQANETRSRSELPDRKTNFYKTRGFQKGDSRPRCELLDHKSNFY